MAHGQDQHDPNLAASAATPLDAVHAYRTTMGELLDDPLPDNPFPTLEAWLAEATRRDIQPNPNAMALATATDSGEPSVRVVLCRGMDTNAGSLWFYTNASSRKGRELASNPRAAVAFHWDALDRQARVEGTVEPLAEADSGRSVSVPGRATRAGPSPPGASCSRRSTPRCAASALTPTTRPRRTHRWTSRARRTGAGTG